MGDLRIFGEDKYNSSELLAERVKNIRLELTKGGLGLTLPALRLVQDDSRAMGLKAIYRHTKEEGITELVRFDALV